MKLKKLKHLLLPLAFSSMLLSSSCNTTNIYQTQPENKQETKEMKLLNKYNDYKDSLIKSNLSNSVEYDDIISNKYQTLPEYFLNIINDLIESKENLINDYQNVFDDKMIEYFDNIFKLKDGEKHELNNVNNLSLKDKIKRLKKNIYVYSKTQDFLDQNNQEVFSYDFAKKFNNQELNLPESFYISYNAPMIVEASDNPGEIQDIIDNKNQEFKTKKENWLSKNKNQIITYDKWLEYLKMNLDNYYMNLSIEKQLYRQGVYPNSFSNKFKAFMPLSSISTDNLYYETNEPRDYYVDRYKRANNIAPENDDFKASDVIKSIKEDDVKEVKEFNKLFKNAKMNISNNINAKNQLALRNVKLFNDISGQGTILFISEDYKMYVLSAKHVFKNRYEIENEFKENQSANILRGAIYSRNDFKKLFNLNDEQLKAKYGDAENIEYHYNYDLKLLDTDYSKYDIKLNHSDYKIISLGNKYNDQNKDKYDQILVEIDLSKQSEEIKNKLKNNRGYLNPIKLNNDAYYGEKRQYAGEIKDYLIINNQSYFVNDTVKENINNYKTLNLKLEQVNQYNPVWAFQTYLKEKAKANNDDTWYSFNKDTFENHKNLNAKNFNITENNLLEKTLFANNRERKFVFKGWDDWEIKRKLSEYELYTFGLNYDQNEYFNLYDFETDRYYYSSSNMYLNIQESDKSQKRNIVKLFLGYIKGGNSGQGLMNTKYELENEIANNLSIYNDNNLNKDNYNFAFKVNKTNNAAYDEMKYIITSGIIYDNEYQKSVDINNVPYGLNIAQNISNEIIKQYNKVLDEYLK